MERSSIVYWGLELVSRTYEWCLIIRSRMCTYRLGGSRPCLR